MTSTSLHPTPRLATIAREQLRAVGIGMRRESMFFLALLVFFAVLGISAALKQAGTTGHHGSSSYGPEAAVPMALLGLLIPLAAWRDEGPARRAYHWAMPMARTPHALTKLLAGWAWLMVGVAIYVLYIAGLTALMNTITGAVRIGSPVPAWQWAIPFTAATVAYLFGSAAAIGSDHPMRWIGGSWIGFFMIIIFLEALTMPEVKRALMSIVEGDYGIGAVAVGGNKGAGAWAVATLLWSAIGTALIGIALRRRAEG
jgi:hypothetical protein